MKKHQPSVLLSTKEDKPIISNYKNLHLMAKYCGMSDFLENLKISWLDVFVLQATCILMEVSMQFANFLMK